MLSGFPPPAFSPGRSSRRTTALLTLALAVLCTPLAAIAAEGRKTTPPVPTTSAPPPYPANLQRAGIGGVVILEFVVNARGRVEKGTVIETPHPDLGQVALDTLKKWRFTPATVDGKPVAVRLRQSFTFGVSSPAVPAAGAKP